MILFEVRFMQADNVRGKFVYENLELFIVGIVTIYVPLYYYFHNEFGWVLDLKFITIAALMKIQCQI